jgi:hypothetical protein
MKQLILALVLALAGWAGQAFALQMDVTPKYGTTDWAAYVQADKDAKLAGYQWDYVKQAETTPFSWVKAWAYYNAAGKLATGQKEDGLWNFGEYELDAKTLAQVEDYLDKAQAAMQAALASGVYPHSGPNVMSHLEQNIESAKKYLSE